MSLYSIGHSNHAADAFLRLLEEYRIDLLADVRSRPFSRWNPQFNRETLAATLQAAGIGYRWFEVLGGLGSISVDSPEFIAAMDELIAAAETQNVALMCAERDPNDCHRQRKLGTWAARERGVILTHIVPGSGATPVQVPQRGLFE